MQILVATKNPAKFETYGSIVKRAGFKVLSLSDFPRVAEPEIEEDRHSLHENAKKKAASYARAYNKTTVSSDEGLCVENFRPEWNEIIRLEPRRLGTGTRVCDEAVIEWYNEKLEAIGGSSPAYHMLTMAVANPSGKVECSQFRLNFLFCKRESHFPPVREGYPLDSQSRSLTCERFLSELPYGADWPIKEMIRFVSDSVGKLA